MASDQRPRQCPVSWIHRPSTDRAPQSRALRPPRRRPKGPISRAAHGGTYVRLYTPRIGTSSARTTMSLEPTTKGGSDGTAGQTEGSVVEQRRRRGHGDRQGGRRRRRQDAGQVQRHRRQCRGTSEEGCRQGQPQHLADGEIFRLRRGSAAAGSSKMSRSKEWLTIDWLWRGRLPENLDKGTVVKSIVELGMQINANLNRHCLLRAPQCAATSRVAPPTQVCGRNRDFARLRQTAGGRPLGVH